MALGRQDGPGQWRQALGHDWWMVWSDQSLPSEHLAVRRFVKKHGRRPVRVIRAYGRLYVGPLSEEEVRA
jgi:hypothetical protein